MSNKTACPINISPSDWQTAIQKAASPLSSGVPQTNGAQSGDGSPQIRNSNLTFEDLATVLVEQCEPLQRRLDELEIRLAEVEAGYMRHRGTWCASESYRRGDVVTHDGSAWCALVPTKGATPGKSSDFRLFVKKVAV
jgi:hypothetical protein